MSNETNQDRQLPTEDQPPPKQYATGHTGQPGEHTTDEHRPKVPDHVETEASTNQRGKTPSGGAFGDKRPTNQGTTKDNKPEQDGQGRQEGGGSRSGQSAGSGSSGGRGSSSTGSGSGKRPGGGKP